MRRPGEVAWQFALPSWRRALPPVLGQRLRKNRWGGCWMTGGMPRRPIPCGGVPRIGSRYAGPAATTWKTEGRVREKICTALPSWFWMRSARVEAYFSGNAQDEWDFEARAWRLWTSRRAARATCCKRTRAASIFLYYNGLRLEVAPVKVETP